jgi:IS5 family transposase
MKHRSRPPEQDDLLRPRLVEMIDLRHELVKLTALIGWEVFEREWAGFFPSTTGRPATPPRLVAGLLYLQHAYRLSDEAIDLPPGRAPCQRSCPLLYFSSIS